jgi:ankyrin repeat protein
MTRSTKYTSTPKPVPVDLMKTAIVKGNTKMVAQWLEDGGLVNGLVQWENGVMSTPLIGACIWGHVPLTDLLLELGADVNLQDSYGGTALMHAAREGHATIVRRLLHAGAQLGVRTRDGYTAQKLAEEEGHHECVRAIREHLEATVAAQLKKPAEVSAPAVEAQAVSNEAMTPGAAVESADEGSARGMLCPDELQSSLGHGDVAGVAAWLDGGGQVDCGWADSNSGVYDTTTLMYACVLGHLPVVDLLLERGAGVDVQNNCGSTALMYAAAEGHAAIVRRLLRAGAQTGVCSRSGRTALMAAHNYAHHKCARILREHEATAAAEKREHEVAMAAEKRARRKDKKRAAREAVQAASVDKAAVAAAAAEAARLEHEEMVRRHDEREAAERAEAKAAEEAKRAQVAAQRLAKAQTAPKPLTSASQQPAPKAKAERSARRTEVSRELEHQVHTHPEQKTIRAAAFDSRQVVTKEDAAVKKARAHAQAIKEASARASAEAEAARHVVPSAPTMSDMMAGKLG